MVLKTFNVSESVYKDFSYFCKSLGLSMSKQIDMFMRSFVEEDPKVKEEYLKKLEKIRKGNYTSFTSVADLRNKLENA